MASRYWVGGTANWDNTAGTKWSDVSGGVGGFSVPTSADDVYFDAASGAITCTQTAGISFLSINFTGFTGTFASSGATTISANGNITFGSGMTITSTSNLSVNATATITSNGKIWTGNLNIGATITITLAGNWTVTSFSSGGANAILNGNSLNVLGSITMTQNMASGTTNINLTGTGTWSGSGQLKNNLTINTAGTITISGTVYYNTGILTYTSGTVETGGSTLTIGASTTLDTGGMNWNNLTTSTTNPVVTLLSDLNIKGNLTTSASFQQFNGAFNVNVGGSLGIGGTTTSGTAQLNLIGIGTWSAGVGTTLRLNTTIKANANIILGSLITYQTGILTIEKQAKITTRFNSALTITNSCTLINIHKCNFKTVTISSNQTITMNEFFSGSPDIKTNVRITGGTTNYKIAFTDTVPKKAFHVNTQYCTINNRNQLTIVNRDGNAGFNQGILFGESGMCGIPLNQFPIENSYPFQDGFKNTLNY